MENITVSRLAKKDLKEAKKFAKDVIMSLDFYSIEERKIDIGTDVESMDGRINDSDWTNLVAKADGKIVGLLLGHYLRAWNTFHGYSSVRKLGALGPQPRW